MEKYSGISQRTQINSLALYFSAGDEVKIIIKDIADELSIK